MLTQEEQEACIDKEGLFGILSNRFKPWYNEMIKSLQFHKLVRQQNESPEEWMGTVKISGTECNYNDLDRQLKQQFICALNDNNIMIEIIVS